MELLKTSFGNGGQRLRCVKIVGKGGFSAYMFNFLGVFCETIRWGGQRIVAISMVLPDNCCNLNEIVTLSGFKCAGVFL